MDKVKVHVGTKRTLRSGQPDDNLRPVEFEAEELARVTSFHGDDDTRGVTEILYQTVDDRLIVYTQDWTKWQGETSHYTLQEIEKSELEPNELFEALGREAGMDRPLTLDEALG